MSVYLFTNNATTTLASDITFSATTLTLAVGTGALFPTPSTDQVFNITVLDAATQLINEIMTCTARTADVLTVIRGQEGTTAIAWDSGSIVSLLITAGELANFTQSDEIQTSYYNLVVGGGTVNAITGTLDSNLVGLADLPDGFNVTLEAPGANTAAVYFTLTLGDNPSFTRQIIKNDQVPLVANDIPAQYYPCALVYSQAWQQWVMNNPTGAVASGIAGGAANEVLIQTAADTTGFIDAPVSADSYLIYDGTNITWTVSPTIATATNLEGGTQYQIPYQSAASTTTFAPAPTEAGAMFSFDGSGFAWIFGMNAVSLQTANFSVFELDGKLVFQYHGSTIASLSSTGVFTTTGSVVAAGTP